MTDPMRDRPTGDDPVDPVDPTGVEEPVPTGLDDTAGDPSTTGDPGPASDPDGFADPDTAGLGTPMSGEPTSAASEAGDPTAWGADAVTDPGVPSEDPFVAAADSLGDAEPAPVTEPIDVTDPFDTPDPMASDPLGPEHPIGPDDPFATTSGTAGAGATGSAGQTDPTDPFADPFDQAAGGRGGAFDRPEFTPLFAMAGLADLAASVVREMANEHIASLRARKERLADTDPAEAVDEAAERIDAGAQDANQQFQEFLAKAQERTRELFDQALAQYEALASRGRIAVADAKEQARQQRVRAAERVDTTAQERAEDVSAAADRMAERISRAAQAAADRVSRGAAKAEDPATDRTGARTDGGPWVGGGPDGSGPADDNRNL